MERFILTSSAAFEDIKEAKEWYEEQRRGLSDDFELCLGGGYDALLGHPEAFQVKYKTVRVYYISRFPYGIHYTIEGNFIYILGVFHSSENPLKWEKR